MGGVEGRRAIEICGGGRRRGSASQLRAATAPFKGSRRGRAKGVRVIEAHTVRKGVRKLTKKRGIIGFRGVALAEVTSDTITQYATKSAIGIPYAGSMSRKAKESSQDFYYDDDLYAQVRDAQGDDVEVRFAEMPLEQCAALGLGTYDAATGMLEADFGITGREYAFRCAADTVSGLPMYFNWRVFELTGIRFDNFATRGAKTSLCEVVMTGVFKRPLLASAKAYAIRQPREDGSDAAACDAWLLAAEAISA